MTNLHLDIDSVFGVFHIDSVFGVFVFQTLFATVKGCETLLGREKEGGGGGE